VYICICLHIYVYVYMPTTYVYVCIQHMYIYHNGSPYVCMYTCIGGQSDVFVYRPKCNLFVLWYQSATYLYFWYKYVQVQIPNFGQSTLANMQPTVRELYIYILYIYICIHIYIIHVFVFYFISSRDIHICICILYLFFLGGQSATNGPRVCGRVEGDHRRYQPRYVSEFSLL
jgi:hypothetical protein